MQQYNRATHMSADWRPDDSAFELLSQHSIPRDFAEDQIPEFQLYWRERREAKFSWSTKFVQHVIHAWRRHQSAEATQQRLTRMYPTWTPDQMALDQLASEGVPTAVVNRCLTDFVLYWMEAGRVETSWSAKFLDFTRSKWGSINSRVRDTRQLTLHDQLTDTSWADKS